MFTSFGPKTDPERTGMVLAGFWTNFQAELRIVDKILVIFCLGPI